MALITQTGAVITTLSGNAIGPQAAITPPNGNIPQQIIEMLRARVGLAANDPAKDTEIEVVWIGARQILETYLDRYLEPGAYSEVFTHVDSNTISLKGYPVDSVDTVLFANGFEITSFHVESETGLIHFDGRVISHEIQINYEAHPPSTGAIMMARLAAFDVLWGSLYASGGGGSIGAGVVKSVSIDGMRTEYFDPTSGGGTAGIDAASGLPAAIVGLIDPFKRKYC